MILQLRPASKKTNPGEANLPTKISIPDELLRFLSGGARLDGRQTAGQLSRTEGRRMPVSDYLQNLPTTSLATVYKTVALIKELGEVLELAFGDGSNRYDGNKPYPHPHVVCIKCKTIIDPDLSVYFIYR